MRRILAVVGVLVVTSACGVPSDDEVRVVDPEHVPYRLLSPDGSPSSGTTSSTDATSAGPRLYWTDAGDHLTARPPMPYCAAGLDAVVDEILTQLTAGPNPSDRAAGLGTAMPPEPWVELVSLRDGTARLRIAATDTLDAARVPLAAGQVVLSVTSVDGVDRVAIEHADHPLHVPLPDGELAAGTVGAADYAPLLADRSDSRTPSPLSRSALLCPAHTR